MSFAGRPENKFLMRMTFLLLSRCTTAAFIAVLIIALAACATVPSPARPSVSPDLAWQARKSGLIQLQSWTLNGRIAIKNERDAWNASIHWQQRESDYDIRLSTSLGQGVARLQGNPSGVTFSAPDEEETAADVTELLRKHLGWAVPIEGLRYWVLGLPDPHHEQIKELDDRGRLVWLEQSGWHIEFIRYQQAGGLELPGKIVLKHPELQVRLMIDRWEPGSSMLFDG